MTKTSAAQGSTKKPLKATTEVTFWGVRGTLPTPSKSTQKYGGNTSCVEVLTKCGKEVCSFALDAGSGLSAYGEAALARGQREFHIFLSHVHYDHIMGLTRFAPIFRRDCKVSFYGLANPSHSLHDILRGFFQHPYFPVEYDALGANPNLVCHEMHKGDVLDLHGFTIRCIPLNHPQGAAAFRIESETNGCSLVYATDHEHGTAVDAELIKFSKDASLFIYDSTFHNKNYEKFKGWGHSTAAQGAKIAAEANVKAFGIFHHDPASSDKDLESISLPEARKLFKRSFLCAEGKTLSLNNILEDLGFQSKSKKSR